MGTPSSSDPLSWLVANDTLEPGERLRQFCRATGQPLLVPELLLRTLAALDAAVEEHLGVSSLYLMEDDALRLLLRGPCRQVVGDVSEYEITHALILLNCVDLIFRFACAPKFGIADVRLKQVRISRWGKSYLDTLEPLPAVREYVTQQITSSIQELTEPYGTLVTLLSRQISDAVAADIRTQNALVPVKLLS